ncbi:DUF1259 domain-containing protein [Neobacillus niacini]|uniref:DUF1259 domain-containing protein n=1 Tax=Neobacillus niacini TaxID=86668 RepID=UPI002FFEC8C7
MNNFNTLCHQFANILNGKPKIKSGVCSVELDRNLNVSIQGRPIRGELGIEIMFESMDSYGNTLNRGETVLLDDEVLPISNYLVKNGISISALHNHWLFAEPNILYMHFQSVEPPLIFARKISEAIKMLK